MSLRRFEGRNVLVTGASRGIGASLARRLAAEGANLFLVARHLDPHDKVPGSLRETVALCEALGAKAHAHSADLADQNSRLGIIPAALEHFKGHIDVVINNAAAAMYGPLLDYPGKRLRLTYEVNTFAPLEICQQVLPSMITRGEGWIVNVSSATAKHNEGPPFRKTHTSHGIYGSSKAALNRITNDLAVEMYEHGVRINTIEPRAAVMSEGAQILVGDFVRKDQIESMEEMVEATLALCCCDKDSTGAVHVSLDLIDQWGLTVHDLDAKGPWTPKPELT